MMPSPSTTQKTSAPPEGAEDPRFAALWSQLFGGASIQVHFADAELNARVYTLDGETSAYKVQNKKVGKGHPINAEVDTTSPFPKKARRGEVHGRAVLTQSDVAGIRQWAAEFVANKATPPYTAKAAEMNISEGTLRDIVKRRTWTHIYP